jgi:uroporphyrinogen-III synthase
MRALVTRPREEAEMLAPALSARGFDTLIEPMMEIHFRDTAPDLAGIQAVLCTSTNGVRALARANENREVPLFAVGDATAARARLEGFRKVANAGGGSADLVRLAAAQLHPGYGPLLYVSGIDIAGDLASALQRYGFTVDRCVLYEARPAPALSATAIGALADGEIDFALFFSPRTAAIFVQLAGAAGVTQSCATVIALSISASADKALNGSRWRERLVAERPDRQGLLDMLDRVTASWRG